MIEVLVEALRIGADEWARPGVIVPLLCALLTAFAPPAREEVPW